MSQVQPVPECLPPASVSGMLGAKLHHVIKLAVTYHATMQQTKCMYVHVLHIIWAVRTVGTRLGYSS